MGQSESIIISEEPPRQIKLTFPNKKNIIFIRGKRNTEGEILSDRDFFYFTLFRCLELYCWKYNPVIKTNSGNNLSNNPRTDSPKNSPRLKKMDSVLELASLARKNQINANVERAEYIDRSNYTSELKEEILDVIKRLIGEYVQNKDVDKISLAIDTYVSDLKIDKFPHYINYRPNLDSDLSIALCFSLGFYKDWLSLPHSWLYQHEWAYLMKQGIWLLDDIGKEKKYLDVLVDNDKRVQSNEISINNNLSNYNYNLIMDSLKHPQDKHKEYLNKLIKTLSYDNGLVSQCVITWYHTFIN